MTSTSLKFSGWLSWSKGLLGPGRFPYRSSEKLCRELKKKKMHPATLSFGGQRPGCRASLWPRWHRIRTYTTSTLEHWGPAAITCRRAIILGWMAVVDKHTQRNSLTTAATGPAAEERERVRAPVARESWSPCPGRRASRVRPACRALSPLARGAGGVSSSSASSAHRQLEGPERREARLDRRLIVATGARRDEGREFQRREEARRGSKLESTVASCSALHSFYPLSPLPSPGRKLKLSDAREIPRTLEG